MTCLIIRLSHKRKYIENGYSTCTLSMIRIRNYRRRIYKQVSDNIIIRYATIYIHIESKYMLLLLNYFSMFGCFTYCASCEWISVVGWSNFNMCTGINRYNYSHGMHDNHGTLIQWGKFSFQIKGAKLKIYI